MHVALVDAEARLRYSKRLIEMHHDRKRVFVDQLGWQLPSAGSWLEIDQFDNEYTVYLIVCSEHDGRHLASVRLLPTNGPHMLNTIFADLSDGGPVTGADVWESSRFTIAPVGLRGTEIMRLSQILALAHVEFALLNKIGRYTMIGEVHRLATVCAMGWRVRPLCLPTDQGDGRRIVSMEVTIDEATLAMMRRRFRIDRPVLSGVREACYAS